MIKNTPFLNKHLALGAKMAPFAGYNMPISYTGVNDEHDTVRNDVGVFDVSHMGEFKITGEKALDLIQRISSNDASVLFPGKIQYSTIPNDKGGIVDDFLVYKVSDTEYYLVVNASNIEKDWNWISSHNKEFGCKMENLSDDTALLAIQGPKAIAALQSLTDVDLSALTYYTFTKGKFAGFDDIIISATGYTGAGGFEIYMPNSVAEKIWDAIFEAGKPHGIKAIGLAARDTLRLEMGFCLYGNDINDTTSPLEAGLGWVTKFTKNFVNSENLAKQKEAGVSRKLIGFEMIDKGIPRHDYEIVDGNDKVIGVVTSGTMSPSLKKAIGLGYVPTELSKPGSQIFIKVRDKALKAEVVKIPFYKN
jgi:aminomethyltransferase